jgi:hypothetical protein
MVHGIESHRYYISTSQAGTIEVNNKPIYNLRWRKQSH